MTWQLLGDLGVAGAYQEGPGVVEHEVNYLGQVMTSLIPWRLGRIVVRFDPRPARRARLDGEVIVTEGAIDALSAAAAGYGNPGDGVDCLERRSRN